MLQLKHIFLYTCRALGGFALARRLYRKQLNILCYHGFSHRDEHLFRPKLFMLADTFNQRLQYLERHGYQVRHLDEALVELEKGALKDNTVVITVDDGWLGTLLFAHPLLKAKNFPWTLYLTTYYAEHTVQVVNLAIQYLLWKTQVKSVDIGQLTGTESLVLDITNDAAQQQAFKTLNQYCDQALAIHERPLFLTQLADELGLVWDTYLEDGVFRLINAEQVRKLADDDVAIELHTHRHVLPEESEEDMLKELHENAEWIERYVGKKPRHFCYPSGLYNKQQLEWLAKTDLASATTCHPGFNDPETPLLELKRFLDGENIHQIEFEAEVSGFKSLLRRFL